MRNTIGSLLALAGAAATLASPWQAWYNGRHGSGYKFYEVFGSGVTASKSGIMDSVFLVFLVTAALTVAGVLMRWRAMVGAAAVVAFGFTILWMVRQGQAAGELVISSNSRGLGAGVALAFGGGLLMIVGALMMSGERKQIVVRERIHKRDTTAPEPTTSAPKPVTDTTAVTPVTPPAERAGTERLSKQEREQLGLDEETSSQPKPKD